MSRRKQPSPPEPSAWMRFLPLGVAALATRLVLAPWIAHSVDVGTFMGWAERAADVGLRHFYDAGWCDYLPGYIYILTIVGHLARILPETAQVTLIKLPSMLGDVATAWIIWRWVNHHRPGRGLWVAGVYLFNPAVLINSTLWGQVDGLHALTIIGGLYLLARNRPGWSGAVLGFAAVFKPHTIVILPLVGVYALTKRISPARAGLGLLTFAVVAVGLFIPMTPGGIGDLPAFIDARVDATMGQYHYASINALNLWYLAGGNFRPDTEMVIGSLTRRQVGTGLFALAYAFALVWFLKRYRQHGDRALWESVSLIFLATFLFVTRAHERHLFPYFPFAVMILGVHVSAAVPYVLLSVTYLVNMVLAWFYLATLSAELASRANAVVLCLLNLGALPLAVFSYTDRFGSRMAAWGRWFLLIGAGASGGKSASWTSRTGLVLGIILTVTLGARLLRLNAPPERCYDEVYHAFTAERYLAGDDDAWRWDKPTPEPDCAYEWTHPPLAKLFMTASMGVFGREPWAWRLPAALFGTACVGLVFLITRQLTGRNPIALLAATLAAMDPLMLIMSRIGMNDIYCVAFLLAGLYFALRRRPVLTAVAAGLAISCKWTGLFVLPLVGLILLFRAPTGPRWKLARLGRIVLPFVVAVPGTYLASYIPFFAAGNSFGEWIELQQEMWDYHTGLEATHPYASPAYHWPLSRGGIYMYGSADLDNLKSAEGRAALKMQPHRNIFAIGNPVIWISGLGAMAWTLYAALRGRRWLMLVVPAGYLLFWAPWLISPRIMFLTHYLPALPFLYIALAWALIETKASGLQLKLILAAALIVFLAAYPYVTAWPLPWVLVPYMWMAQPAG